MFCSNKDHIEIQQKVMLFIELRVQVVKINTLEKLSEIL